MKGAFTRSPARWCFHPRHSTARQCQARLLLRLFPVIPKGNPNPWRKVWENLNKQADNFSPMRIESADTVRRTAVRRREISWAREYAKRIDWVQRYAWRMRRFNLAVISVFRRLVAVFLNPSSTQSGRGYPVLNSTLRIGFNNPGRIGEVQETLYFAILDRPDVHQRKVKSLTRSRHCRAVTTDHDHLVILRDELICL
jgi:hypothetical protein